MRERVVRLKVQMVEMSKKIDAMHDYTRQLYYCLNKLGGKKDLHASNYVKG